jgi:outer membrane protein TolC
MSLLLAALLAVPAAAAPAPVFTLSLTQAEEAARAHALDAKAAAADSAAARDGADAQFAALIPRLTLDGYYRYQTEVPRFSVAPGAPAEPFGSNRATSIGPTLNWTLWDEGALYKTWQSQKEGARSREETERLVGVLATQAARLSYVQVQLAREKVRLLADSVALADAQYADVEKRLKAGAASRIDWLSSHQEDLQRRKDFYSAQSDLSGALRSLFQLTGLGAGLDLTRPVDVRVSTALPAGLPEPTLRVLFDSIADTPALLAQAEAASGPAADHPAAASYARLAESARLAAGAEAAGLWPKVQFSGSIYYQYPNGPVLQYVTQKTAGLSASVPLFDMHQTSRLSRQQKRLAEAATARRDLAVEQLARDWDKAKAALAALRDQESLDGAAVTESAELARLVYLSYKAGRANYLDVQTYDLASLQAKVNAAQTRAQILIQLAALAELRAQG